MKKQAYHLWQLCYPMLIYTAITYIVVIIFSICVSIIFQINNPSITEAEINKELLKYTLHLTCAAAIITTPVLVMFKKRDDRKTKMLGTYKKYENVSWFKYLLIIPFALFTMYAASAFVSVLVLFMPDFMTKSYESTKVAIYGSSLWLQILTAGIMGPIVEEYVFRGLIYKRALRFSKPITAALISSILFGIYHGNWIQLPYAFLLGLALAFVYEKYKNMFAPILLHISSNMISVIITQLTKDIPVEESNMSTIQEAISYIPLLLITGMLVWWLGSLINSKVHTKEIKNEVINSSDSML